MPRSHLVEWTPVDSLNALLPSGIRVFYGENEALPLRAWYVRAEERSPDIETRVAVSEDTTDFRDATSTFARQNEACVALNGGYFRMGNFPASAVGLLVQRGHVTAPPTMEMTQDGVPIARAALGFSGDGEIMIGWATFASDSSLVLLPAPLAGEPLRDAHPWRPAEAIGAGPMLLRGGRLAVTADEEGFTTGSIPHTHPRTAAGRTADGALLLMVVDGRQPGSRGVNLTELAYLMREAEAVDALNLDGGGSSTLVVRGHLVNRPTGGTFEREIHNALVVRCR